MTSSGFLPLILQPTRITDETMTIIDNIYTNSFSNDTYSGNILIEVADHLSQFVVVNKDVPNLSPTPKFKRDFSKFNDTSFIEDLTSKNWCTGKNVHDRYKALLTNLETCVESHVPLKKLNKNDLKLQNKPWITPAILKMIKQRNSIFSRLKSVPANDHLRNAYRKFRNTINRY